MKVEAKPAYETEKPETKPAVAVTIPAVLCIEPDGALSLIVKGKYYPLMYTDTLRILQDDLMESSAMQLKTLQAKIERLQELRDRLQG